MDYEKRDFKKLYEDIVHSDWFKRAYHDKSLGDCPFDIPELRESEDERIRKEIIGFIQSQIEDGNSAGWDRWIAWLEKQKEQKPVEIHIDNPNIQKFDPDVKVTTSDSSASGKELLYVSNKSYDIGFRDGVASVKPAEWSEEDEKMLVRIIERGQSQIQMFETGLLPEHIAWLKSLRPSWKPSEEQMTAILRAEGVLRLHEQEEVAKRLAELYEQLKKLM